jgi:hypothetical protein
MLVQRSVPATYAMRRDSRLAGPHRGESLAAWACAMTEAPAGDALAERSCSIASLTGAAHGERSADWLNERSRGRGGC